MPRKTFCHMTTMLCQTKLATQMLLPKSENTLSYYPWKAVLLQSPATHGKENKFFLLFPNISWNNSLMINGKSLKSSTI